jgi:hypothetical protein
MALAMIVRAAQERGALWNESGNESGVGVARGHRVPEVQSYLYEELGRNHT